MAREKKPKQQAVTKADLVQIEERRRSKKQAGPDDLSSLIASVQESLGGAARIQHLHEVRTPYGIRRPTGVADLDLALKGGFPGGTMNQVFGPDGCLDQDTLIQYTVRSSPSRRAKPKEDTIKRLYELFHGLPTTVDGHRKYTRASAATGTEFTALSVDEWGQVRQNDIANVVDAGMKECFLVTTHTGRQVVATGEHEFFTGKNYVALHTLRVGNVVHVHNNAPRRIEGASEQPSDLPCMATPDKIVSIEPAGIRQVYDIKMAAPFHNFVANGFVVHNSGKDLITNHIIAANQDRYGEKANAFWMSFGYKPDIPFMRMAGCQIALSDDELRLAGVDPAIATPEQRGRDVGNVLFIDLGSIESMENPAETLLTAVIKLVRSNRFQVGIINELGSGETKDGVAKGLAEDKKVASWANLMTTFCQKFYTAMRMPGDDLNETTLFMLLPVRANLDSYTSKFVPYSQPSGYALKHAKAVDLHIKSGQVFRDKSGHILRKDINWKISKGKLGISEGEEGTYQFVPGAGIDLLGGMVNTARAFGIIHRHGAFYQILDYEDRIKGGIEGVVDLLRSTPELAVEVKRAVHEHMMNGVVATDLEEDDG